MHQSNEPRRFKEDMHSQVTCAGSAAFGMGCGSRSIKPLKLPIRNEAEGGQRRYASTLYLILLVCRVHTGAPSAGAAANCVQCHGVEGAAAAAATVPSAADGAACLSLRLPAASPAVGPDYAPAGQVRHGRHTKNPPCSPGKQLPVLPVDLKRSPGVIRQKGCVLPLTSV